mgnify:FL=1
MKRIAIIGSHGLYAKYGGWDQLVKNLAELKSEGISYIIFNSSDTPTVDSVPSNVIVKKLWFKASGFQGLFFDYYSILYSFWKVDTILLLGVQGIPLIPITNLIKHVNVVSNVGGIEWERPKFSFLARFYLRFCFKLSFLYSTTVILDNAHYKVFMPKRVKSHVKVIPYGGFIDESLDVTHEQLLKYPFLIDDYFLSISRSLEDNKLDELCECFTRLNKKLVLISNFSKSTYGISVYNKYKKYNNIILIDGLYVKPELDLIRRKCKAYIHTHTLCGTAPSLVEMIMTGKPIISVDIPQNRYTLNSQGIFYTNFDELFIILNETEDFNNLKPDVNLKELYNWKRIVREYEALY